MNLDPVSHIPLYLQLADAIAYRIAVGRLRPGDRLDSMRDAGEALGIHYLTVRKAYATLEERGLVERRRGIGTRVTESPPAGRARAAVHAVECNAPQAADYAVQLAAALRAPVGTRLLDDPGDPPPGLLVGTYFHFNEIRERWPDRGDDLRFVAARPDPDLSERVLEAAVGRTDEPGPADAAGRIRVRLCETRRGRAHNVLPDLAGILPDDRFAVESVVVRDPSEPLAESDSTPVLYSPRLWARLGDAAREDRRAVLLRYRLDAGDVAGLRRAIASGEARAS